PLFGLLSSDRELLRLGISWLDLSNDKSEGWPHIWLAFLRSKKQDLTFIENGALWVLQDGNIRHPSWHLLLEAVVNSQLIEAASSKNARFETGLKWYKDNENHGDASYILLKYLDKGPQGQPVAAEVNNALTHALQITPAWIKKFLPYVRSKRFN